MPNRFRFRLQPVLDLRQRREDEKQRIVARLDAERLAVEDRLRDLQRRIDESRNDLRAQLGAARSGPVAIADVRTQATASLHLQARARQTALELAGAYKRVERARLDLLKAARDRRAVELLKERRLEEWKHERNRVEYLATDEAATQMFIRNAAPAFDPQS